MVKYLINDEDIFRIVENYEYFMEFIQGFKYGEYYVIRDLGKPRDRQEIWRGQDMDDFAIRLKTECARRAIRVTSEVIQ